MSWVSIFDEIKVVGYSVFKTKKKMGRKTLKFEEKKQKVMYHPMWSFNVTLGFEPIVSQDFYLNFILFLQKFNIFFFKIIKNYHKKSLPIAIWNLSQGFFILSSSTWSNFIPKEKRERAHKNYAKMTLHTRNSTPSSSLLSHCIMLIWLKNYSFLAYT